MIQQLAILFVAVWAIAVAGIGIYVTVKNRGNVHG